jgi:membrane protease YdiL (CAAX protease family)
MPLKLTSPEYKIIAVAVVVMAVSLGVGVKYFWRVFPEAAIEFRVNRDDSEPLARRFLAERGIRLEGYRHAAVFRYDDDTKVYLERSQGLERMNGLTRGPVRLWRWSHRWFRPQQQEEFRVDVTPAGEVAGFAHEIPEATPGANLDAAPARAMAEEFVHEVMKRDLADLEFVEGETEKRPARTDHSFTWKQKSVNLGEGSLRIEVDIGGDQVAGYQEFIKIPEQWSRDYQKLRARNVSAQMVAEVVWILLCAAMLIILVQRLRDRDVPVKLSLGFGMVAAVLLFLGRLNTFPLEQFDYRTTDSYSSFITGYVRDGLLSSLGLGALIFLLVASSEPVYRQSYPQLISLRRYLSWQGLRSRSFFMANVIGIGLTFFFFAYQTLFYLAAEKFGAWAPADVPFSNLINTRIPWVSVLFIGFLPAVSEELQFRAFAIPFLKRILRSGPVALVLAAFIWGFLHAAYPNQPFFIRGVEVGLGGVVMGLIMLRFGILATLIWHYSVDALYTAFVLLRSPNHYLMVSGALTAGIMLIPLMVSLVAYWRTGRFADESTLTNASVGISRAPRREAVREPETPLAYRPLDLRRLTLVAVLVAAFIALAVVPVHRFGEGISLRLTRQQAIRAADAYLKERQVDPARYRQVAWLRENVDPLALKYIMQQRTVEEADRIYRQATRLVLWEVRYFRPLEKEEHRVFVDAEGSGVFSYRHVLDENAPGAALSPEEARARAAAFLERSGYRPSDFELRESEVNRRKARTDYTLVWQAKPGNPNAYTQVGDAYFRLQVDVAGDQVVGLARYFKLPELWQRQQSATTLPNVILLGVMILLGAGLVAGGLVLLVLRVRRGEIRWSAAAYPAAAVVGVLALAELNRLCNLYQRYDTSEPLSTFWISNSAGLLVWPVLAGLVSWVLVGLATSLYPEAWRIFRGSARRLWRRDAAIAILVTLAAAAALSRITALIVGRFHAYAPVGVDLVPDLFDASWPGVGFLMRGLLYGLLVPAIAAVLIYLFRLGWTRRAWWLWVGGFLLLVSLGPPFAHSVPEFFVSWALNLAGLVAAIGIVAAFYRDNVLAYVAAAFCLLLARPVVELMSQPAAFFRWNGLILAVLALAILAWMLLGGSKSPAAT